MFSSPFHSFVIGLITLGAIGNVANAQAPLPSCSSLGISSQAQCTTQCESKGSTATEFRGVNGSSACTCAVAKLCDDAPSCKELLIEPGFAETQCRAICATGETVTVNDYARFAGDTNNANIDQTHLVISCACNGVSKCSDNILFSDRVQLPECATKQITSQATCKALCDSYGTVFLGHYYNSRYNGEESVCDCTGANGQPKAPYCADLDRRASAGTLRVAAAIIMSCLVVPMMI